ncbi:oxygenase MpaB family protein [Herbiconiux flava]|uniref:Uncharacterized protein (DUF2236 family) n=1 Tax=Herbiconiux flava TaxID=881268 RepID=A0A852SQK0_9MICO|nr:oxygenase MpaB family protein [Herbiconiux flava]NYD71096.1 uncharacterized protein (DUF2236 family) [Herbiconiux flava]GLK18942.1 hypothetical protein GCM10017602_34240 [Herbiconiux flava]
MVRLADIAPEGILLAGAGRAILLQIAMPGVGYGVARHSDFASRPMSRLNATLSYIYALSNGSADDVRRMRKAVNRAHAPVANPPRGPAAGPPEATADPHYDARDPELQLWVAATLYDTAIAVYERVYGPLTPDEAERVYREYAVLGTALQMPAELWPADRAAFHAYWEGMLPQLSADPPIRAVARELLRAERAALPIRVAMPLARFATIGLLPPSVRTLFGFRWTPVQQHRLDRLFRVVGPVYRRLPRALRHLPQRRYLATLARRYP